MLHYINWHDEEVLTADGLLLLERYLIGRTNISEGPLGSGLHAMGPPQVSLEGDGRLLRIRVKQVGGVTGSGLPVAIDDCFVENDFNVGDNRDLVLFLSVQVNARRESPASPLPNKFTLIVTPVAPPEEHLSPSLMINDDTLALGVFAWHRADPSHLKVERYPRVRRLGALRAIDPTNWDGRMKILRCAIATRLKQSQQRNSADDPRRQLLFAELAALAFDWVDLPIADLVRRCQRVRWLSRDPHGLVELPLDQDRQPPEQLLNSSPPDQWPGLLADLLHTGPEDEYILLGPLLPSFSKDSMQFIFRNDLGATEFQIRTVTPPDRADTVLVKMATGHANATPDYQLVPTEVCYTFTRQAGGPRRNEQWLVSPLTAGDGPRLYYRRRGGLNAD